MSVSSPVLARAPRLASRRVASNGLVMHYLEAGAGDPIVLLHGFPDSSGSWRALIERLALTHRVIAPDLRGYNLTSRPAGVEAYRTTLLVADIVGLLDALDLETTAIAGNDWGGVLAFWLALQQPHRVSRLIGLNTAHPFVLQDMIWDDPAQRAASQYMTFLRPAEADAAFGEAPIEALVDRFLGSAIAAGTLTGEDVAGYRAAWSQPGVWPAMLNWYRAAPIDVPAPGVAPPAKRWTATQDYRVTVPVQLIWGMRDTVFAPAMPERILAQCDCGRVDYLPDAGHLPHRDDPDRCAAIIRRFLSHPKSEGPIP